MEFTKSESIIKAAVSFVSSHQDPMQSSIPDTMDVSPHTHALDEVLKYAYSLKETMPAKTISQLESDILAIRNEVEILLFAFPASDNSIAIATDAGDRILHLLKP